MPRSLLDILKNDAPGSRGKEFSPNISGYTPGKRETAQHSFLATYWKGKDHGHPYGNDEVFSASHYKTARRPAGKDNVEFNKVNHQFVARRLAGDAGDQSGLGEAELQELSNRKLIDYSVNAGESYRRAKKNLSNTHTRAHSYGLTAKTQATGEKWRNLRDKRAKGLTRAYAKIEGSRVKVHGTKSEEETMGRQPQRLFDILGENVTRKHFQEVANTVRAIEHPGVRQEYADHHASIFAKQNPRFSHEKFHAACGTLTQGQRGSKKK